MMQLTEAQQRLLREFVACRTWEQAKALSAQVDEFCGDYSIGGDASAADEDSDAPLPVKVTLGPAVMAALSSGLTALDPEPPRGQAVQTRPMPLDPRRWRFMG